MRQMTRSADGKVPHPGPEPDNGSTLLARQVLKPAYQAAGWRGRGGNDVWTWHSLRHVFCTTALAERLRADAANMERPGADLTAYYLLAEEPAPWSDEVTCLGWPP
jgi:hypothetical protein